MENKSYSYLDKNIILDKVTKENVIQICYDLGSSYREDKKGNIIFNTRICHDGDSDKLYCRQNIREDDGLKYWSFHCYTCGESYDLIELIIRGNRINGKTITWYRALLFLANLTGYSSCKQSIEKDSYITTKEDFKWINALKASYSQHEIPSFNPINENVLETFCYLPHEEWLNDNISQEAISRYEISYYGLNNSIIIPHRDRFNNLIGIRQRLLDKDDITRSNGKYMPLTINGDILSHSLGNNLYGINVVKDKVKRIKKCLLVESEKSCMQVYSYFGDDAFAMAVCGNNITNVQSEILLKYLGVEEIIVGFDKEYDKSDTFEAEAYYNSLILKVAPLVSKVKVTLLMDTEGLLGRKDSPSDRGKEILLNLLENKIAITTDEVVKVKTEMEKQKKIEHSGR